MKKILSALVFMLLFSSLPSEAAETMSPDPRFDYKKQDDAFWKKVLQPDVYQICRRAGTEPPFSGKLDKFYEKGTYYCGCCGGDFPLYKSEDKFDSKTGWPSFSAPFKADSVELVKEDSLMKRFYGARTEVRCARCGSHLGHVFDDGPAPTHKRFCMNSLALTFTPEGQQPKRTYEVK